MTTPERIVALLAPFYDQADAHVWLYSPQALLGGGVPVDLIRKGRAADVLAVVYQLRDGVHI